MERVITFGCRLNACESSIIDEFAQELGIVNYTIINTCAVTAEAERQLRQKIRQLHRQNPSMALILTGCAVELSPENYLKMEGVVGIISNKNKLIKDEYSRYSSPQKRDTESLSENSPAKVRGFLQIQNGCNNGCTYCIVRSVRGRAVSFNRDDIVAQAKRLLSKGYKEIVLTGVNISSYGQDLSPCESLSDLIRYLLRTVPEIKRLRLSSLDPANIDDDLMELFSQEERIMPHIHESVQSGDNMILARMGRRHNREMVIDINSKIEEKRKDVIFGADIIAGFPTETDEMCENTRKLLSEGSFSLLHVFPYSKRPKTSAALMPQVPKKTISDRAKALRAEGLKLLEAKLRDYIGRKIHVLAESDHAAKTDSFLPVKSRDKLSAGHEYWLNCIAVQDNVIIGKIDEFSR